VIRIRRR